MIGPRVIRPACECGELLAHLAAVRTGAFVVCVRCGRVATYDERHDLTDPRDREPSGVNYNATRCAGRLAGRPCPALVTPTAYLCPLHHGPARVTAPPRCPECGGPPDTGAGHDCEA